MQLFVEKQSNSVIAVLIIKQFASVFRKKVKRRGKIYFMYAKYQTDSIYSYIFNLSQHSAITLNLCKLLLEKATSLCSIVIYSSNKTISRFIIAARHDRGEFCLFFLNLNTVVYFFHLDALRCIFCVRASMFRFVA